ncbi:MAG: DUF1302 domain-containing protein [Proteobacteria bacterium]|nr:DUF1302 domain-containing protein [Pseudomonadota bacterium]MBU4295410.1 DUF1302 domain-containing protein [Pseudomonadota bacterium]MCG2748928.1 DUF1302 domain-containing protein [Desulfobulbaceae bacterium]
MKSCSRSAPLKKGCKPIALAWVLGGLLLLTAGPAASGESDLFGGFEETPAPGREAITPANDFAGLFSGYAKMGTTFNTAHHAPAAGETDWRGLSRLRAELQLEADYRLQQWRLFASAKGSYDFAYSLNGRGEYTADVLDEYEWEAELREAFVQREISDSLDVKLGRQIIVWGRSDNFRVTDILNPLDNREPGLTDIEDLRLPTTMSKLDYFRGNWQLSAIAVHEHRFDKLPPFGSDFYPASLPAPPEEKPAATLGNTGLALEVQGIFSGWDISFYGADIYNDQSTIVPSSPLTQEHRRIKMAGAAMNLAQGNFLYILEAAHFRGLCFLTDYDYDYSRTDLLAGIEYRGFTDTAISVDLVNRHLHDYRPILKDSPEFPQQDASQAALRITRELLNDRLNLTALLIVMGERAQEGALERFTATYDLADNWSMTCGMVFYQSGNRAMVNAGDNDRVFLEVRLDF